jgi:hypothetical protein
MSSRFRFSLRFVLVLTTLAGIGLGLLAQAIHRANNELRAAEKLRALGASMDDWIGWREILGSNYRPIVDVQLPPNVRLDQAMTYLIHLDNLEYLTLGANATDADVPQLAELDWITSLNASESQIGDGAVPALCSFTHLRWLYFNERQLSDHAIADLKKGLPGCSIEVRP